MADPEPEPTAPVAPDPTTVPPEAAPAPVLDLGEMPTFLRAFFEHVPPGVIEVRLIRDDKKKGFPLMRHWYPSADSLVEVLPRLLPIAGKQGRGVFFGVLPRLAEGKGKGVDSLPGMAAWTDLDFKDFVGGEEEARRRLKAFPLPPTAVSGTGHGLHPYWFMKEPTDIDVLVGLSARLAEALNGDYVADAARVLRLPCSFNHKDIENPLPVVFEVLDLARRYNPDDLDVVLPDIGRTSDPGGGESLELEGADAVVLGAEISPRILAVFEAHPEIRDLFEGKGKPETDARGKRLDTSSSGYDISLACALARQGVSDQGEIATALCLRPDGRACEKGKRYVLRTVRNALRHVGGPEQGPEDDDLSGLPTIIVPDQHLRDLVQQGWRALHRANLGPAIFLRAGCLARLAWVEGVPRIEPMEDQAVYGHLARIANWVRLRKGNFIPDDIPRNVAKDMLVYPDPALPALEAVVSTPVFDADGHLVSAPGYHPEARLWMHRPEGFDVGEIPADPAPEEIRAARDLFLELLVDFPFVSPADRAHALAAILLPYVRRMVKGCTPVHLVEAPIPGAGKGLLSDLISIVTSGRVCEPTTLPDDEEEARKKITSILMRAAAVILLDNVNHAIQSAQLASALTAEIWSDRILGESRMVDLPNRSTWLLTANNPQLSLEIARRCVRIRLDPRTDRPWERTGFRHQPLRSWAMAHRAELVRAALVLIQAWIAKGKPTGAKTLGSFESWAEILGGILQVAGVEGFLQDTEKLYQEADPEGQEWREFVAAWWEARQGNWVGAQELLQLALDLTLLGQVVGDKSERSQRVRLGKALSAVRDRQFGGYRILSGTDEHRKAACYRLVPAESQRTPVLNPLSPSGSSAQEGPADPRGMPSAAVQCLGAAPHVGKD